MDDSSTEAEDPDDSDPDQLIERWVELQRKIFSLDNTDDARSDAKRVKRGRYVSRARTIERDVLFDAASADEHWQPIRRLLQIEAGEAKKLTKHRSNRAESPANDATTNDELFEDDAVLGGLFNDESAEESITNDTATTGITVRDFGLLQGIAPRRILEEALTEQLARQKMRYTQLATTTYSSRLQLQIHWQKRPKADKHSHSSLPEGVEFEEAGNIWRLKMTTLATKNSVQSESLLATLAMFLLISTNFLNAPALQRLPKTWRQFYQDLQNSRSEFVVKEDIATLRNIRGVIPVSGCHNNINSDSLDESMGQAKHGRPAANAQVDRLAAEEVRTRWLQRTKSDSFTKMLQVRESLPVYEYKHKILQAFDNNRILIICADTGAGKSTQIPSYLLEYHLSKGHDYNILVTQPRRISAISLARRVSTELGEDMDAIGTLRSVVGYAIRMESKLSASTRLTFATTGVLLRMLQDSRDLDHIDCLVLDEVHERTMDLDLLFIALKKLQQRRSTLKIVLMSATVNALKFSSYFNEAPVLDIPGRTFPVDVRFLEDAVEETLGVNIQNLCAGETEENGTEIDGDSDEFESEHASDLIRYSVTTRRILMQHDHNKIDYGLIVKLASLVATSPAYQPYSSAMLIFMPGIAEIRRLHNMLLTAKEFKSKWTFHMLHSSFSTQELELAFQKPLPGHRKIVIATNIAETGITIPDVTVVIDTCKEKIMRFDERRQLSRLTEGLISKASARQRRGRAARVRAGLCFHLVTRSRFETKMQEQATPEMLRLSLQEPIMRVKIWELGPAEEVLAAAIDPPSAKNVRRALSKLQDVGAIDKAEHLTALGHQLAKIPLDVTLSKMAVYGVLLRCVDPVITIIASFSVKSIFNEHQGAGVRSAFAKDDSDFMTTLHAFHGWQKAKEAGTGHQFCHKYHLNGYILQQLEDQKIQLYIYLVDSGIMTLTNAENAILRREKSSYAAMVRFSAPSQYNDLPSESMVPLVITAALYPKLLRREGHSYRHVFSNQQLQLAPTSINRLSMKPPNWLCYMEAMQAKNGKLNAFSSSKVTHMILLLAIGHADFRFFAGVIVIDNGRIRLSVRTWREMLGLLYLRTKLESIVNNFLGGLSLKESDRVCLDLISKALDGNAQSQHQKPIP